MTNTFWFLLILGAGLATSGSAAELSLQTASVVSVNGVVRSNQMPLRPGDVVHNGDRLTTERGASAKLIYLDRTIVDVGPETSMVVKLPERPTDVNEANLEWGSVRASIQKQLEKKERFRIRTKSSVLSARGTEFTVTSVPTEAGGARGREQICVADGTVEWTHATVKQPLAPGQQVVFNTMTKEGNTVVDSASVKQTQLSAAEMGAQVQRYVTVDQTFKQAVAVSAGGTNSANFGRATLVAAADAAETMSRMKHAAPIANTSSPMDGFRPTLWQFNGSAGEKAARVPTITVILVNP